jgi:plasmid stabilization system protein ParE
MKKYKVVVLNIAKEDVKEAYKWYEKQLDGLGKRFVDDMKNTLVNVADNPTSFAIRRQNLRLSNFKTFPYAAHFFINPEDDTVFIIAILHTKRHPNTSSTR